MNLLPVDIFLKCVIYLPFRDVISICSVNKFLYNYGSNPKYSLRWKSLIERTFSRFYNYQNNLKKIQTKVNSEYNYLVYTQLNNLLGAIDSLMVYYYQKDMELLNENLISPLIISTVALEMAKTGDLKGLLFMKERGADIHIHNDLPLRWACEHGHLSIVKYLVEQGANIHTYEEDALRRTSRNGRFPVVKFLVEQGANIHAEDDEALESASHEGHLEIVMFLVEHGADIQAYHSQALISACQNGRLNIIKYLVEHGADIHHPHALDRAIKHRHSDVVKYLLSQNAQNAQNAQNSTKK